MSFRKCFHQSIHVGYLVNVITEKRKSKTEDGKLTGMAFLSTSLSIMQYNHADNTDEDGDRTYYQVSFNVNGVATEMSSCYLRLS